MPVDKIITLELQLSEQEAVLLLECLKEQVQKASRDPELQAYWENLSELVAKSLVKGEGNPRKLPNYS